MTIVRFVRVYCHGVQNPAFVLGDGWAQCMCGKRIRVVA